MLHPTKIDGFFAGVMELAVVTTLGDGTGLLAQGSDVFFCTLGVALGLGLCGVLCPTRYAIGEGERAIYHSSEVQP